MSRPVEEFELPRFPPRPGRPSIVVFASALRAFLLREFKNRYLSTRLGFVWGLVDPMITVGFFLMMKVIVRGRNAPIYGSPALLFFSWGVTTFFMWQHAQRACTGVCDSSRGLFNFRQIKPIDIMIARALLECLELAAALAAFLCVFSYVGLQITVKDPAMLVVLFVVIFITGLSVGLLFEVYGTVYRELRKFFAFIMRPMMFISGLYFSMASLSQKALPYFWWNPVFHLVDLVHGCTLPAYESPASLAYVLGFDLVVLTTALASYRRYMHELL
jgi:capsular polysaccharide transport system permease protein